MIVAAGGEPLWFSVLATTAGLVLSAAVMVLAALPWLRRRAEARDAHERRVEATCDAVNGKPADPSVGRYEREKGLAEIVPEIQAMLGRMNGKTVMQHIEDIETHIGMREH